MKKVAILVDGDFYLRRYRAHFGAQSSSDPVKVAHDMWLHCMRHINKDSEQLYRIYFYDCPPLEKRVHHPVSQKVLQLGKSDLAVFRKALHQQIIQKANVALRLGYLDEENAVWRLRNHKVAKQVISGQLSVEALDEEDYVYYANQKGVDMKIGLDIATLAYKQFVEKIVLVAGDSDFVPASKLARREGINFVLDPMRKPIKPDLAEHIDGLKTTLPYRQRC